jgi:hypothetical protein
MLDLIELELQRKGFDFERIDGQTSLEARGEALRKFNEVPHCTVMLASIGSCGEGCVFFSPLATFWRYLQANTGIESI